MWFCPSVPCHPRASSPAACTKLAACSGAELVRVSISGVVLWGGPHGSKGAHTYLRESSSPGVHGPHGEPPVAASREVVDELRRLHPNPTAAHREAIDKLRAASPVAAPAVDPDMVRKALASFAPTSAAGPSGLRPSHLQEALRQSSGDQTLLLISEVMQMQRGEILEDIRSWVCGVSVMALRKLDRSLRPVAVGETLRGLSSKLAVDLTDSSVRSIPEPVQVGVQTKDGHEAVVHTTRQRTKTFCDDPDRVLVLIDLANAFNCVSRGAVLSAVRRHFPWLATWADTCCRYDSILLVGSSRIHSQRGVQQGNPLQPSLFALAIHPCIIKTIRMAEFRHRPSSLMTGSSAKPPS